MSPQTYETTTPVSAESSQAAREGGSAWRAAAPYVILAALTVAFVWPLCIGRSLYWGDIQLYFEPMQNYARHELREGRLPLWNPYILCGQPFIGNPQMSVFYPTTVLLPLLPGWMAMSITTILHLFLCGAFMYLFLRRWTVHLLPALAGAIVYMGSAYLLGRLQFPPMIQTAAFYPLLFAMLDLNVDRPSLRHRVGLSFTVALIILAAHTQVAYLAFGSAAPYAIMRLWRRRTVSERRYRADYAPGARRTRTTLMDLREVSHRAVPLMAAAASGLILAGIYLLPAIQLLHESPREQMSVGQANRFYADFPHILSIVFPRFAGHPITRDFWARGNAWEPAAFVGWAPLALAAYAALRCRKENLVRFWLVIGLAGAWLALGSIGGLYWMAFYVVPGLANFHDPARFLLWSTVAASVLTAVGLDALQLRHGWRTQRRALLAVVGIAAPLLWFAGDWLPTTTPRALEGTPAGLRAIRLSTEPDRVALTANTLYWKRIVTDGYIDYGSPGAASVQRTIDTALSNLEMRNGLESASGYEPVPIAGHIALEGLSRLALQRREPNALRLTSLMDVRLLLLPTLGGVPVNGLRQLPDLRGPGSRASPLKLWRNPGAISRSWLTRSVRRVEGRTRIAAALTAPGFDPARLTIVSGIYLDDLGRLAEPGSAAVEIPSKTVAWRRTLPGQVHLSADAEHAPALLVYSGTAFPGWKASVDGRPARLLCADGALLGVVLPPGKHEVVLKFSPDMFRIGAYLSLFAAAGFCARIAGAIFARKRGPLAGRAP